MPGGALFFWAWWNGYLTETLRKLFNPFLWLVFFCIAPPWFIYLYLSEGIDPILGFFLKHNFQRYTSTFEGHSGPFYYYLVILIFLVAPFWNSLFTVVGRIKTDFKDETRSFLWIWFLWVLLFFSISSTKLPHYLLYGITPLFILMALNFKQQSKRINLLIFISLLGFISSLPIVLETLASSEKDIIWNVLREVSNKGISILIIDKISQDLKEFSNYSYILERGKSVWNGKLAELSSDNSKRFLGV